MADTKLLVWVGVFLAAYIIARILFHHYSSRESEYEKQLKKVLDSDKYKVKGRHD